MNKFENKDVIITKGIEFNFLKLSYYVKVCFKDESNIIYDRLTKEERDFIFEKCISEAKKNKFESDYFLLKK